MPQFTVKRNGIPFKVEAATKSNAERLIDRAITNDPTVLDRQREAFVRTAGSDSNRAQVALGSTFARSRDVAEALARGRGGDIPGAIDVLQRASREEDLLTELDENTEGEFSSDRAVALADAVATAALPVGLAGAGVRLAGSFLRNFSPINLVRNLAGRRGGPVARESAGAVAKTITQTAANRPVAELAKNSVTPQGQQVMKLAGQLVEKQGTKRAVEVLTELQRVGQQAAKIPPSVNRGALGAAAASRAAAAREAQQQASRQAADSARISAGRQARQNQKRIRDQELRESLREAVRSGRSF